MPVIILGGIYGGIFTPTEAAAVSVVYGLFVGMVIYREVSFRDLFDILVDSAKTTGGIMLIVASASLFSFVCTKFGIADAASGLLASIAHNQFVFLLIVNDYLPDRRMFYRRKLCNVHLYPDHASGM